MVRITIDDAKLAVELQGWDQLWALRSRVEVPLAKIQGVRADPNVARGCWKGIRVPGTHVPGAIIAGTFYQDNRRIFWAVKHPTKAIVIDVVEGSYDRLVVEVEDPLLEVQRIRQAMPPRA
jgi:hypothetical protein